MSRLATRYCVAPQGAAQYLSPPQRTNEGAARAADKGARNAARRARAARPRAAPRGRSEGESRRNSGNRSAARASRAAGATGESRRQRRTRPSDASGSEQRPRSTARARPTQRRGEGAPRATGEGATADGQRAERMRECAARPPLQCPSIPKMPRGRRTAAAGASGRGAGGTITAPPTRPP